MGKPLLLPTCKDSGTKESTCLTDITPKKALLPQSVLLKKGKDAAPNAGTSQLASFCKGNESVL